MDAQQYTVPDQRGRVALVTGANGGLGFEVAKRLAQAGARVVMACRNTDKATGALAAIEQAAPHAELSLLALDLASQASVREAASRAVSELDHIDVLVNNAGVMAVPHELTEDGWERQIATNHFGHFTLTALLWPLLAASSSPRVVSVSSGFHMMGVMRFDDLDGERFYNPWVAYAQSKLADLLFIAELQGRLADSGSPAMALAAHPGYAATDLQTGGRGITGGLRKAVMDVANGIVAQSPAMGALPTLHAAASPHVVPGGYYGPGGLGGMHGFPVPAPRSSRALDAEAARRLWEVSEERTGVQFALVDR